MKRSENIHDELIELGANHLINASREMPYKLSKDYFDNFGNSLNSLLFMSEKHDFELPSPKGLPYSSVPQGYFDGLSQQVLNKIKENDEIVWSKANPYTVPNKYFETLSHNILLKIKRIESDKKATPKRIPLYRTVQLAASMALIIFVGLGVFRMNHQKINNELNFDGITKAEIAEYVNSNIDDFDTDIVLNALSINEASLPQNEGINSISTEDIKEYMSEDGLN